MSGPTVWSFGETLSFWTLLIVGIILIVGSMVGMASDSSSEVGVMGALLSGCAVLVVWLVLWYNVDYRVGTEQYRHYLQSLGYEVHDVSRYTSGDEDNTTTVYNATVGTRCTTRIIGYFNIAGAFVIFNVAPDGQLIPASPAAC